MNDNFRAIFENAPIGMAIASIGGEITNVNKAVCLLLGYDRSELIGSLPEMVSHPDDVAISQNHNKRLLNGELNDYELEKRYIKKDGSIVDVIVKTSLLYDSAGKPHQLLGQLVDITPQKIIQNKIIAHERLLNNINENIEEAIYRSIPGEGLAYVNNAFVKMFGWNSIDECLQCSEEDLNDLFYVRNGRQPYLKTLAEQGQYKNKEILFKRRDGSTFWGLDNCIISRSPDGSKCIDGVIVDITERRLSEETLMNTNKELKKINNELDQFVYSASHDLKAPLTSLRGLLNIATSETDSSRMEDYLDLMQKSVSKLESFIQDIIHYSRNSRTQLNIEKLDLEHLVNDIVDKLKFIETEKDIKIEIEVANGVEFYSDLNRLSVILTNIISNAILYYDPTKASPFIKIKFTCDHHRGRLEIEDNGVGIKEEYLSKIFDMFYRASEGSSGSGLGLYIVKEAVERLEGEINVESEYPVGTTFHLSIPNSKVLNKNIAINQG